MRFCLLLSVVVLLAPCSSSFAQKDMNGNWRFSVPNGGLDFFQLKQEGTNITSVGMMGPGGGLSGTVQGSHLHLQMGNGSYKVVYDATVNGDKFPGVRVATDGPWGGTDNGTFERISDQEMHPARLPLPELRDLPDNGLVRTPPMGWNSWNKFHDHFDDATVRAMSDALASSGMANAGYEYVIIDEGWSSGRDANGKIVGNARFPDMKALAAYIHSKGLKAGIYSSPGPQVCGGYQGSYGHEIEDAQTFADWGYDYLKYDWCSAFGIYQPTTADLEGAYQKMGEALQKTKRPIVYSLCEYGLGDVWKWGAKSGGNLWRTTFDISDNWNSMEHNGFAQLDIVPYTVAGHYSDPDMLEVGNGGMTADEYRTHISLWAMLRAPLIAGNDVRTMTEETKSILMNPDIIAIDQDPEAKPVRVQSREGKTEVLVRELSSGEVAVGLFNRGDKPAEMSVRWDSLSLGIGLGFKSVQARDLWAHTDIAAKGDSYTVTVPAHGVAMLRAGAALPRFP